jgi:hypothetical protein
MKWQRLAAEICVCAGLCSRIPAAEFRSANFQVTADSADIAREVAQAAEELRSSLARDWLDQPLDTWNSRCSIRVESQKTGGSMLHVQAGGGVVLDSDPEAELQETLHKSRALFRAAGEAWRFT